MNLSSRTPKIKLLLRPREVLNVENRQPGMAIECRDGMVWITRTGGHTDQILRAGSRYTPSAKGSIVIEAIGESCENIVATR